MVEHVVATAWVVFAAEEVVEPHFVQRCSGGVCGDVSAHFDAWALRAVNHDSCVPAEPATVPAFNLFVSREPRFVFRSDRVNKVCCCQAGHADALLTRTVKQAEHDIAGTRLPGFIDDGVKGLKPFLSFLRICVGHLAGETVKNWSMPLIVHLVFLLNDSGPPGDTLTAVTDPLAVF